MTRPKALGKGLSALLPPDEKPENNADNPYFLCPTDQIQPNPYQPRKNFSEEALRQLSESIRDKGILQPLVVRKRQNANGYELIAGERRLQAAKMAGLTEVPALLKDVSTVDRLEIAIIENIQRQNLNPLEEGEAYARLMDEFGHTQEEVARQVGKQRSTVANTLRLLQLPEYAKDDVVNGAISTGHARVLLAAPDLASMRVIRDEIISRKLSVRQAEALVKKLKRGSFSTGQPLETTGTKSFIPDSYRTSLANTLASHLGTRCKIIQNGDRGKVELEYFSLDDLERLVSLITGDRAIS
ncbi:MAG: ParB/RepB/Spo0J family partition protein [Proteobacteria bacterium]|nr:ParB/RepB/Spo0J family partition protein [Pseudomonadota bacterium]MBU1687654.1 ParB/RepB/Spo0J family partition protein [Pseudomonadota bacterium]